MSDSSQIDTVARLLVHHLSSSVELGLLLADRQSMRAGMVTTGRLGDAKSQLRDERQKLVLHREYELLFLTKLSRARYWADLLQRLAPDLRSQFKAFSQATRHVDKAARELAEAAPQTPSKVDFAGFSAAAAALERSLSERFSFSEASAAEPPSSSETQSQAVA